MAAKYLCRILGLHSDEAFLVQFKGDWNRFCNSYQPENRTITTTELQKSGDELFLPIMIKLDENFGRFYEIYLKHKFLPDVKFVNKLDGTFASTIVDMHAVIGMNPFPQDKDNSPDLAYDVRYRGIILIDYLTRLSQNPWRYIEMLLIRWSIYLLAPITLLAALSALVQSWR